MRLAKWFGVLVMFAAFVVRGAPGNIATNGVNVIWVYPTSALGTNQVLFKLYSTTDLTAPMTAWPLVKSVLSTNGTPAGTNLAFTTPFPMQAEARYFVMTASNFWGEGNFSNVASTPAAPRSDVPLFIGLAP